MCSNRPFICLCVICLMVGIYYWEFDNLWWISLKAMLIINISCNSHEVCSSGTGASEEFNVTLIFLHLYSNSFRNIQKIIILLLRLSNSALDNVALLSLNVLIHPVNSAISWWNWNCNIDIQWASIDQG